jgi:hypothetical protein
MTDKDEQFIADPTDHLIAVIDDYLSADAAERDLVEAGFNQVHVYKGQAGVESIDSSGSEHGVAGGVVRGVQQLFSNKDNLAEYEDATRKGAAVIAVHIDDEEARDRAATILAAHHARDMNHFGKAVVHTLNP